MEKKNLFYIVILENCSKQKGYKNKQAETQIKDNNATEIYKHLLTYQCQFGWIACKSVLKNLSK